MGDWSPAVLAINGYQRFISPYKGFCCAHRIVTGKESCSEFVKQKIRKNGLFASFPEINQRFRDCKKSAWYLNERKKEKNEDNSAKSDAGCIAMEAISCVPSGCGDVSVGTVAAGGCDGCACTPI